ncbi:hypothetical protein WICPIJ_001798 [Wickerhamomyces pijperi]|uniref:Uncharacterized protein n=1 Tax=Wickerhamomyces pijperi TaxID=599730 RepID=A0A9P8QA91_WICPI|nr:hypothetical protein WICPIJ_001798 [Wickerhamomyces pijperi]
MSDGTAISNSEEDIFISRIRKVLDDSYGPNLEIVNLTAEEIKNNYGPPLFEIQARVMTKVREKSLTLTPEMRQIVLRISDLSVNFTERLKVLSEVQDVQKSCDPQEATEELVKDTINRSNSEESKTEADLNEVTINTATPLELELLYSPDLPRLPVLDLHTGANDPDLLLSRTRFGDGFDGLFFAGIRPEDMLLANLGHLISLCEIQIKFVLREWIWHPIAFNIWWLFGSLMALVIGRGNSTAVLELVVPAAVNGTADAGL